jgi:UDP-N-acetylmuramyl pentapeptide phosphotransferase/UDP-N-acetylglucosamine-1-phosphate transferase
LIASGLAAVVSAALTWALRPMLLRHALAKPNARSSHRIPTPQGAGIAVIAATLAIAGGAIAWSVPIGGPFLAVVFAATIGIAIVGLADDVRPIAVMPRFLLQALAVGAVVFTAPDQLRIVSALPLWAERGVLLLAGLWFVNLVNFMDGLDWITTAEVIPIAGALTVLGLSGELPVSATFIAAALGGAMLGFAPFNRPVAKIFLGDVGSLPIGLLLGWCLLELAYRQHVAAALLLPLYYLADASVTLLRRLMRREAIWRAHRSHFYQRATDNGFSVLQVDGYVFVANIALAVLAWLSVTLRSVMADAVLVASGAGVVALLLIQFSRKRR